MTLEIKSDSPIPLFSACLCDISANFRAFPRFTIFLETSSSVMSNGPNLVGTVLVIVTFRGFTLSPTSFLNSLNDLSPATRYDSFTPFMLLATWVPSTSDSNATLPRIALLANCFFNAPNFPSIVSLNMP